MPIFEYQCQKCGYIFEEIFYKNVVDKISTQCPVCQNIAPKIMSKGTFKIRGYSEENGYSKEK